MPASQSPPGRTSLEVADIFRGEAGSFWRDYSHRLSSPQKRVYSDIQACRTAVMGGHVRACEHCDHHEISYNSCRNRHCPKCQARARANWLEQRAAELLPISYFHVVFTLPSEVAALALQNKRLLYGMLFEAASQTLMEVAANPRHLGADWLNRAPGRASVLGARTSLHHPHSGTAWSAVAGSRRMGPAGSPRGSITSCPCEFSAASFATSFGPCYSGPSSEEN